MRLIDIVNESFEKLENMPSLIEYEDKIKYIKKSMLDLVNDVKYGDDGQGEIIAFCIDDILTILNPLKNILLNEIENADISVEKKCKYMKESINIVATLNYDILRRLEEQLNDESENNRYKMEQAWETDNIIFIYNKKKILYTNVEDYAKNEALKIEDILEEHITDSSVFYGRKDGEIEYTTIKDPIGKMRYYELNFHKVDIKGEEVDMVIISNVTEKKEILKKHEDQVEQYKFILDNVPDSIYIMKNNKIIYANKQGAELCGKNAPNDIIGQYFADFLEAHDSGIVQQQIDILKRTGVLPAVERKYTRKSDGKEISIEMKAMAYMEGNNKMYVKVCRDLKSRRKIEKYQDKVRQQAAEIKAVRNNQNMVNDFFANISHEFRTPINIILNSINLMGNFYNNEEINIEKLEEYRGIAKNNSHRLLRLVNNMIDANRVESGGMGLELEECNIIEVVEDTAMSIAEYVKSKGIEFGFDTDSEEIMTHIDRDKIERSVLNVLSNAVKFTNEGGRIFVDLRSREDRVEIAISDTGIGIPEHQLEDIFKRFVQVNKSYSRSAEGSGIGLHLVKSFIELHDGTVRVTSQEGVGTNITLIVPINKENREYKNKIQEKESVRLYSDIEFSDIYLD